MPLHVTLPPICLIGAPTDVGASVRGAGMGPDALRVAGLVEALHANGLVVRDRGNLAGPPTPWTPPEAGLQVFDMRHIDEHGMRTAMAEALHDVNEDTHLHVSFDLDCLDPADAPGVGTGVRGGPTYREMQLCMEMIADTGALASLDVVEINPALDVRNRTAEVAVELIQSLFGASILAR